MPVFHFDNKVFYRGYGYQPGDVAPTFSEGDVRNLTKGGSGHGADACQGDCLAVKNGNAASVAEKVEEPNASDEPTGDETNPSGEGSDDSSTPPADPKPEGFRCDPCAKDFANAAGLASHNRSKHQ